MELDKRPEIPPVTLYMLKQSENNRRARYYRLTPGGCKQLGREIREFERVMAAIVRVIQPA